MDVTRVLMTAQLRMPTPQAPLDLRDGDAIDRLGAAIFERWGALAVLGTLVVSAAQAAA